MKREYKMTKILASVLAFFFVFVVLAIGYGFAGEKAVVTEGDQYNGWKEVHINVDINDSFVSWCGSTKKLLLRGKNRLIKIVDVDSGEIIRLNPNIPFSNPSCSYDGRYVFYTFSSSDFTGYRVFLYDTKTKNESIIYSLDKKLPILYFKNPLSPSGKYLIGPPNWKENVQLPTGEVKIVPIYGSEELVDEIVGNKKRKRWVFSEAPVYGVKEGRFKPIPNISQTIWSSDSSKLFLLTLHPDTLFIRDLKMSQQKEISLKIKGYNVTQINLSQDNTKMYISALSKDDMIQNLYEMDLTKIESPPKLLVKMVDSFGILPDGSIPFTHHTIDRLSSDNTVYLLDKERRQKVVKKFSKDAGTPYILGDGRAMVVLRKGERWTIWLRNGK